jgi:uncharacterized membrane protein YkvA (DUF1232 family)
MFFRIRRLFKTAGRDALVLWYACRNPETPVSIKLIAAVFMIYIVSPFDIIPDALPILGWLDDAALLGFGIPAVLRFVPQKSLTEAYCATERLLSSWKFWRAKG